MASLSESHKENFIAGSARLGFSQQETSFDMSHPAFENDAVTFGSAESGADIVGKKVPVASIADLRKLANIPVHHEDAHVTYPEALTNVLNGAEPTGSPAEMLAAVAPNYKAVLQYNVKTAAVAYLVGQPEKVADY